MARDGKTSGYLPWATTLRISEAEMPAQCHPLDSASIYRHSMTARNTSVRNRNDYFNRRRSSLEPMILDLAAMSQQRPRGVLSHSETIVTRVYSRTANPALQGDFSDGACESVPVSTFNQLPAKNSKNDVICRGFLLYFTRIVYSVALAISLLPQGISALCQNQQCASYSNSRGSSCSGNMQNNSRTNMLTSLLSNYDSLMRPHFEEGEATTVTCDIFINSVDSISVDNMDYSVNIYLRQSWVDRRLAFEALYPNVSTLTLDTKLFDMIWVPDLFFPNEKEAHSHCITMPNRLIRIYPNGTVWYSARYTLRLSCHMSLQYFPLDKQVCYLILESYGYTLSEIRFVWRNDSAIQMNDELELPQFDLISRKVENCKKSYITGEFTCLKASFRLHRKYGYYMIQNYVPSFLIVILSWVSFWINIDAVPARISLGVLTVLTMTTQSVGVWMSLPRVSYVKAIDVWMSTCVMAVFLAMLQFAIVNTLARKEIRKMSLRVRADAKNGEASHDVIKRMTDEYTYGTPKQFDPTSRMLARRVDKVSRKLFPGVFVLFNVVYWTVCFLQ